MISVNSTPRDLASFLAASHSSRITHLALLMIHLNILSVFSDKKGKPIEFLFDESFIENYVTAFIKWVILSNSSS